MGRDGMASRGTARSTKYNRIGHEIEINGFKYKVSTKGNLALRWSDFRGEWIKTNRTNDELHEIMNRWQPFIPWWRKLSSGARRSFIVRSNFGADQIYQAIVTDNKTMLRELEQILNEDLVKQQAQVHRVENYGEEFS
jgi:hypothetical protein